MSGANVSAARQLRINLDAAWAIAKKDMRIYYLKPPPIMFGIMFPFVIFFSFAIGRNVPAINLLPSLLSITIIFSASSIGPMVIPTERRVRTFERLRSAPISAYSITLGKISAAFCLVSLWQSFPSSSASRGLQRRSSASLA